MEEGAASEEEEGGVAAVAVRLGGVAAAVAPTHRTEELAPLRSLALMILR